MLKHGCQLSCSSIYMLSWRRCVVALFLLSCYPLFLGDLWQVPDLRDDGGC